LIFAALPAAITFRWLPLLEINFCAYPPPAFLAKRPDQNLTLTCLAIALAKAEYCKHSWPVNGTGLKSQKNAFDCCRQKFISIDSYQRNSKAVENSESH